MRAWDQTEMAVSGLFTKLLDTGVTAGFVVFNILDARTSREVIHALGRLRLSDTEFTGLEALLKRLATAATTRNRIIHGHWQLTVRITHRDDGSEARRSARWFRFYQPSDPGELHRMHGKGKDRALLEAHRFSLKDMNQAAERAYQLGKDVAAFTESCRPKRLPDPKPIELP